MDTNNRYAIGIAHEKLGAGKQDDKAREIYLRTLKLDPENFNALSQMANMEAKHGNVWPPSDCDNFIHFYINKLLPSILYFQFIC